MVKSLLKRLLFGKRGPKRIKGGVAKGLTIVLEPDNEASKILGNYEKEIQDDFKRFASICTSFYDIGSYDGYYSLVVRKHNPDCTIVICEAGAAMGEIQKQNFLYSGFTMENVEQVLGLIGEAEKEGFHTVDALMNARDLDKSKVFLKIDVEGDELMVLKGARNLLSSEKVSLIIETHSSDLHEECSALLEELGYKVKTTQNKHSAKRGRTLEFNDWIVAE